MPLRAGDRDRFRCSDSIDETKIKAYSSDPIGSTKKTTNLQNSIDVSAKKIDSISTNNEVNLNDQCHLSFEKNSSSTGKLQVGGAKKKTFKSRDT